MKKHKQAAQQKATQPGVLLTMPAPVLPQTAQRELTNPMASVYLAKNNMMLYDGQLWLLVRRPVRWLNWEGVVEAAGSLDSEGSLDSGGSLGSEGSPDIPDLEDSCPVTGMVADLMVGSWEFAVLVVVVVDYYSILGIRYP